MDAVIYNGIYSRIRRLWSIMSPDREYVMYLARREDRSGARLKVFYKCADCGEEFPEKEVQVDHREAIGARPATLDGLADWIRRVFCSYENLQVLCKPCHYRKSKEDLKNIRLEKKKRKEGANGDLETRTTNARKRDKQSRKTERPQKIFKILKQRKRISKKYL